MRRTGDGRMINGKWLIKIYRVRFARWSMLFWGVPGEDVHGAGVWWVVRYAAVFLVVSVGVVVVRASTQQLKVRF